MWIIKGGPGTGKSTAMRLVAEEAERRGIYHERCRCSSDPDSLDAVIIPEMRRAVYDGTAPHIMEPRVVGSCERIVNFGDAWDCGVLEERRKEIMELSAACARHHAAAQRWLRAAAAFREDTYTLASSACDMRKLERCAARIAASVVADGGKGRGKADVRLLTAVTPKGVNGVFIPSEQVMERFAERLVIFDRVGAASAILLGMLAERLRERGCDITMCPCSQSGRPEHVIVTAFGLVVSVSNDMHAFSGNRRAVHCERFMDESKLTAESKRLASNRRGVREMTELASEEMQAAKSLHDRLERHYAAAVDFSRTSEYARRLVREMFN